MSPKHTALAVAILGALSASVAALQDTTTGTPRQDVPTSGTTTSPIERTVAPHPVTKSTDLVGVEIFDGYNNALLGTLEDIVVEADGRLSVGLVRLANSSALDDDTLGADTPSGSGLTGVPMGVLTARMDNGEHGSDAEDTDPLGDDMRSYAGQDTLAGDEDDLSLDAADHEGKMLLVCKASSLLRSAPVLDEKESIDAAWLNEVKSHFGLSSASPLDPTSPTSPTASAEPLLVGDLVGVDVVGQDDAQIGTLADLALDVTTMKVRYAAVRRSSMLGFGGDLHAMPFEVGSLDSEARELVVSLDEEGAEQLPKLTDDAPWPVAPTTPIQGDADLDLEDRG